MKEIAIMTIIFLTSLYLGYLWAESNPTLAKDVVKELFEGLSFVKDLPSFLIFLLIFFNNSVKSLLSMLLGVFFGIVPVLFVLFNGYLIGVVVSVSSKNVGIWKVLLMLIPHGILEIPAIIIACAYGLRIGFATFKKIRGGNVSVSDEIRKALEVFAKIVTPTLLIAAFIETYITPLVSQI